MKRSFDNGITWDNEKEIYSKGKDSINNPTAVAVQNGLIFLFFNIFPQGYKLTSDIELGSHKIKTIVMYSADNGDSWTQTIDITNQITQPDVYLVNVGPGNGLVIKNGKNKGRVIIQSYAKHSSGSDLSQTYAQTIYNDSLNKFKTDKSAKLTMEDAKVLSKNWQVGNTNAKSLANEISMTEYGHSGKIYYLARKYPDTPNGGAIYDSSYNSGLDWNGRNISMDTFPLRTQSGLLRLDNNDKTTMFVHTTCLLYTNI